MVCQEDLLRRFATYLPANFILGLAFLGISWQIAEPVRYLNPLATLLLLTGPTILASKKFTDLCLYQVCWRSVGVLLLPVLFSCFVCVASWERCGRFFFVLIYVSKYFFAVFSSLFVVMFVSKRLILFSSPWMEGQHDDAITIVRPPLQS